MKTARADDADVFEIGPDGDFYDLAGEGSDVGDVDEALREQRERADALILGRSTFEAFRSYWPKQTDNPSGTWQYVNRVAKYVVSTTLAEDDLGWVNSTILRGLDDVRALKEQDGADIGRLVCGSSSVARRTVPVGPERRTGVNGVGGLSPAG